MRYKSSFIPLLRVQNIEVDLHKGFAHSVNLIRLYGALRLRQRLLTLTEINTALRLSRWYATKISVYQILGVMILSNSDHRLLRWFVLFGEIFAKIVARHLEVFLHRSVALTGAARLFPYVLRQTPNSRLGPAEKYHFSLSKSKKKKNRSFYFKYLLTYSCASGVFRPSSRTICFCTPRRTAARRPSAVELRSRLSRARFLGCENCADGREEINNLLLNNILRIFYTHSAT